MIDKIFWDKITIIMAQIMTELSSKLGSLEKILQ